MSLAGVDVISVLGKYGVTAGIVVLLLLWILWLIQVLLDEDRASLWRGRFYRGIYALTGRRDAEKRYISNNVNGRINLARRKVYFGKSVLPKAVKVEWVEDTEPGTYDISEGQFVVRLNPADSQVENIVNLVCAVVHRTTLLGLRSVMGRPLQDAIDLNLVKEMLGQMGKRSVLDWFLANEYPPGAETGKETVLWVGKVALISERGLFTRVLLVELDDFAKRLADRAPRPYMAGVAESFVEFLHRVAAKRIGEDVPLDFNRAHLNVGIILVAKGSKLITHGIEPYVRAMRGAISREQDAVYVIVFEKDWGGFPARADREEVAKQASRLRESIETTTPVKKDFQDRYSYITPDGYKQWATCTRYRVLPGVRA